MIKIIKPCDLVETRQFKASSSGGHINIKVGLPSDYQNGYGYCNVRIIADSSKINELSFGNYYVCETLCPKLTNRLSFDLNVLPASIFSLCRLDAKFDRDCEGEISVSVDVVKLSKPLSIIQGMDYGVVKHECYSRHTLNPGLNKCQLDPGFHVIIVSSHPLHNPKVNGIDMKLIRPNRYECGIDTGSSMSFEAETDQETTIDVCYQCVKSSAFERFDGKLVETRHITIPEKERKLCHVFELKKSSDVDLSYGYRNLQITGKLSEIESVELEFGGSRFDRIYPRITGQVSFMMLDELTIPAVKWHDMRVNVVYAVDQPSQIGIKYDVVQIEQKIDPDTIWFMPYKRVQFTGEEHVDASRFKVRCAFNHPVTRFWLISEMAITRPVLDFDGQEYEMKSIGHNQYEFCPKFPIDMSLIDREILQGSVQQSGKIYLFAESYDVIAMIRDMYGPYL